MIIMATSKSDTIKKQREFDEVLLLAVRKNDNLFNLKSKDFKNIEKRRRSWESVATEIGGKFWNIYKNI